MSLRRYHAARWDEPLIHQIGAPGRRGQHFPLASSEGLVPAGLQRTSPPDLPELSEPEVLNHFLRLSQETMGMIGVSLFGTCTMKYNPRVGEQAARRLAGVHPAQPAETMQGLLAAVHGISAWHGEGANCWTGGIPGVTDSFLDCFYTGYLLQAMATHGVATVLRQTLVGGDYELIDRYT